MKIGDKIFECGTHVMAIINLTPDSFWEGSRHTEKTVLRAAEKAVREGAAVLDIGAQSTRPGYAEIGAEEEIKRFAGVIGQIRRNFAIPLSVDTYHALSARAALDEGADMINDVWGLSRDGGMAAAVAAYGASVCIMHNSPSPLPSGIWRPIEEFLQNAADKAISAGIGRDRICLDGGIGFAKTAEQNFELLGGYERLGRLGFPLLLGASRKSMFGGRPADRLPQTLAATRLAAKKGVMFVRVHDVAENVAAIEEALGG